MNNKRIFIIMFLSLILVIALQGCGPNITAEATLEEYINYVKEKKVEEAYAMLDAENLPDRDIFYDSIKKEKEITSFNIIDSKELNKETFKFLTNLKIDNKNNEVIFVLVKNNNNWFISLNTDPAKEVEF